MGARIGREMTRRKLYSRAGRSEGGVERRQDGE